MSFYAEVFSDVKKDLAKSVILGGIIFVVSSISMMIVKEFPSELRDPYVLILLAVAITLGILFILLAYRTGSNKIRVSSLLLFVLTIYAVYSLFISYTYKGLYNESAYPYFILFYPEKVDDPVLQLGIENAIREQPAWIKGYELDFNIKKISLPSEFDFNNSLLKKYIDRTPDIVSYVRLIERGDKALLKLVFPPALPFLNIGVDSVENETTDDFDVKASLKARLGKYSLSSEVEGVSSSIHYGFKRYGLKLGVEARKRLDKEALENSILNPLGGGMAVDSKTISGNVHFSFVISLFNLYTLVGNSEVACSILDDYFNFDTDENILNNISKKIRGVNAQELSYCMKRYWGENGVAYFKYLSDDQKKSLLGYTLRKLIKGSDDPGDLSHVNYVDDDTKKIAYELGRKCRVVRGMNTDLKSAECLNGFYKSNIAFVNKNVPLFDAVLEIFKDITDSWPMFSILSSTSSELVQYITTVSGMYHGLGKGEMACKINFDFIAMTLYLNAAKEHDKLDVLVTDIYNNVQKILEVTKCDEINMFVLEFDKSMFEEGAREKLIDVIKLINKDIETDVSMGKLLVDVADVARQLNWGVFSPLLVDLAKGDIHRIIELEINKISQQWGLPQSKLREIVKIILDKVPEDIKMSDSISKWNGAFNQIYDNVLAYDLEGFLLSFYILGEYFTDPYTTQMLAFLSAPYSERELKRVDTHIRNKSLDKLILFNNVSKASLGNEERNKYINILRELYYKDNENNQRYLHFIIYVSLLNGDKVSALRYLDEIILSAESPRLEFYTYARNNVASTSGVFPCEGNQSASNKILMHFISTKFDDKYWNVSASIDFDKAILSYFDELIKNSGETFSELVSSLSQCKAIKSLESVVKF